MRAARPGGSGDHGSRLSGGHPRPGRLEEDPGQERATAGGKTAHRVHRRGGPRERPVRSRRGHDRQPRDRRGRARLRRRRPRSCERPTSPTISSRSRRRPSTPCVALDPGADTFGRVCQLMPNCPLRTAADIRSSYDAVRGRGRAAPSSPSCATGGRTPGGPCAATTSGSLTPLFEDALAARSQDLPELFCPTGAVWWASADGLRREGTLLHGRPHRVGDPLDAGSRHRHRGRLGAGGGSWWPSPDESELGGWRSRSPSTPPSTREWSATWRTGTRPLRGRPTRTSSSGSASTCWRSDAAQGAMGGAPDAIWVQEHRRRHAGVAPTAGAGADRRAPRRRGARRQRRRPAPDARGDRPADAAQPRSGRLRAQDRRRVGREPRRDLRPPAGHDDRRRVPAHQRLRSLQHRRALAAAQTLPAHPGGGRPRRLVS